MNIEKMNDFRHLAEGKVLFPFYMTANDYHDFKLMKSLLNDLLCDNEEVDYKELGCDGYYHAIFFLVSQKNDTELQNEIVRIEKTFDF